MTQISAASRGNPAPITQIDHARAGTITPAMRAVAEKEGRDPEFIREGVAAGRIAIPANIHHGRLSPEGVGGGLRTKVNVNLGISGDVADEAEEWRKVDVALELGGNSPFVVLGDADLEQAVNAAVFGKFLHQGQICMAINRIIVEDSLYDAFAARFVERVKGLRVGDPQRADTAVGPIVNARQLEGLLEKIRLARQEGAKPLYEGGVDGQLLAPHVFGEVSATMEIARDEIFGPLVGLLRARDEAHALELANASEYGLSSAVFSRDLERAVRFARQLRAGMTHVNDIPVNDEANAPFGGEKNSGLGRFNGDWAIEEFTTDHWISVQHAPRQYPF